MVVFQQADGDIHGNHVAVFLLHDDFIFSYHPVLAQPGEHPLQFSGIRIKRKGGLAGELLETITVSFRGPSIPEDKPAVAVHDADGVHGVINNVFQVILGAFELRASPVFVFDFLLQLLVGQQEFRGALLDAALQNVVDLLQTFAGAFPFGLQRLQLGQRGVAAGIFLPGRPLGLPAFFFAVEGFSAAGVFSSAPARFW